MLHRNYFVLGLILFINFPSYFVCMSDFDWIIARDKEARDYSDAFNRGVLPPGRQLLLMNRFGELLKYCSEKDKEFKVLPGTDHAGTVNEFKRLFATVKSVSNKIAYSIIFLIIRPGYEDDEPSAVESARIIFFTMVESDLIDMKILCEHFKENFIASKDRDLTRLFKRRFEFLGKKIQEEIDERRERTEYSRTSSESSAPPPDSQ